MDIKPKKSLGQNFLINAGILEKIVSAAELSSGDTVLEIGPGIGNLTKLLSEKAGRVVATEKDRRLIDSLREKFKNTNIEIFEGDVLKLDIGKLFENFKFKIEIYDYKIVGNIPYYITSRLLKTIFEEWPKPKLIVLTVQKEVAKRIVAKPPNMNLLALSVQFYSDAKIISYVSRGSFRPMPKIDSAIIKLTPRNNEHGAMSTADVHCSLLADRFFKLAKAGFSGKRKQLKNTIGLDLLIKAGIKPESRPQELSLADWIRIVSEL